MGWFSSGRKWESYSVGEIGADIVKLTAQGKTAEATKLFNEFKSNAKKGKIPGVTPKEQKEMEKIYKRASQGEKGVKAALTSVKELAKASGKKNYAGNPLSGKVHPSVYQKQLRSGKYTPTAAEAADLKKSNPDLYKQVLENEARKRGLL
jgi:hypothetical protein